MTMLQNERIVADQYGISNTYLNTITDHSLFLKCDRVDK